MEKIHSIKDISDTLYEILKNDKDLQRIVLKAREILGNNTLANFSGFFAREYVRVRNEVIKRQGNLPEDMKNHDNIRKLEVELEHRYNEYLSELPETKEIIDKKEILSSLMEKDISESKEYYFNPQSEEYTLIKESIDLKKGYEAELILDMKNMELRQNLKYNGVVVNTNKAIKYDSYHDMLRNLPYLLDDNHRDIMLTGYVNEQIQKAKEQSKAKQIDDDWER